MRARRAVAAVDMGAESGRVVTVDFDGDRLDLAVHHRFSHEPLLRDGILRWDFDTIVEGIRTGLGIVSRTAGGAESVGVDAWGVDYGLLDGSGHLVDLPTCYRDPRQVEAMHEAIAALGRDRIYRATGVQVIAINTVFGLRADVTGETGRLDRACTLLMMPDLLHHELCGGTVAEFTDVSTSGAYDMARNRWAEELLGELGVPSRLLPEVVPPGTDLGRLLGATGSLRGARVITPATHDTASAVVGTPLSSPDAVYISSGTWSLIGVELASPCISDATLRANLTNEGGYGGRIRLLRNVMGLWILQECRRAWHEEGHRFDYGHIVELAARAEGLRSIIAPDANLFLGRGDMPGRIRRYCAKVGQPVPETVGAVARCVLDSLALSYAAVVDDITSATGRRPEAVHVVGGGARNGLLAQLTADAVQLPVNCGPVEATALGNAAVQLASMGEFTGLEEIRSVVAASVAMTTHEPRADDRWVAAREEFASLPALEAT